MILLHDNLVDYSTTALSVTSQGQTLGVNNIQHDHQAKVWRTGAINASEYVLFDLGSSLEATSCVVIGHDFVWNDTVKIQGNATDSWTTPSVDETISFSADAMAKTFAGGVYQYWRLYFTKAVATTTRDVGRVYLGTYDTLPQPQGYGERVTDLSNISRSVGGQTFSYAKPAYRTFSLRYAGLSEANYTLLKSAADTIGTHTPFFVQVDTSSPLDEFVYVKFAGLSGRQYTYANCGGTYYWAVDITLEEQI